MALELVAIAVESTGVDLIRIDRIVEVACVRFDPEGRTLDEFASLVNPGRDPGPVHVHGITADQVAGAPPFSVIAGDVARVLRGALVVGHNVRFDLEALRREFGRNATPVPPCHHLSTLQLASRTLPAVTSRRLADICAHLGIRLWHAHSAYADAIATRELLFRLLPASAWPAFESRFGKAAEQQQWPELQASGCPYTREDGARDARRRAAYLSELLSRLPSRPKTPVDPEYLALLDRVIENRLVDAGEENALRAHAKALGLAQADVEVAHREYLGVIVEAALAGGPLSESQVRVLETAARLLGVTERTVDAAIGSVGAAGDDLRDEGGTVPVGLRGRSVCFTGAFQCRIGGEIPTREYAETRATGAGMAVRRIVARGLDYLVTAGGDADAAKTQKAEQLGVRLLTERMFWRAVNVEID